MYYICLSYRLFKCLIVVENSGQMKYLVNSSEISEMYGKLLDDTLMVHTFLHYINIYFKRFGKQLFCPSNNNNTTINYCSIIYNNSLHGKFANILKNN